MDNSFDNREASLSPFLWPTATIGYSSEAFSDSLLEEVEEDDTAGDA